MIERPYVWVDGPEGAGKTTLVERFLASSRGRLVMAARMIPAGTRAKLGEVRAGNDETRRYEAAGASHTLLTRYDPDLDRVDNDPFWTTDFISDYSEAILFEGPLRTDFAPQLVVAVVPPLLEGVPLIERRRCEAARLPLGDYLAMLTSRLPGAGAEEPAAKAPAPESRPGRAKRGRDRIEIPERVGRVLLDWARHGVPVEQERWCFREPYGALGGAGVVVVNVRSDADRVGAAWLADEFRKAHEDRRMMRELFGGWRRLNAVSVFVANLGDAKDAGTRKALARMKRVLSRTDRY